MRLLAKDLTTVYVKPYTTSEVKGDEIASFGAARAVKMNLQSSTKPGELKEYGIKPCEGLIALTTDEAVDSLDGVCINVADSEEPDYQVSIVLKWPSYKKLILEKRI